MSETITEIPLEQLHESPFNPRKTFTNIEQLAIDIQAQGRVLSPLLVRPRVPALFAGTDDPNAVAGFEIVFGHRRYRAADVAALATVPCMVRSMSDEEARRAQISENLQRDDVHPIEEAEGFRQLIDEHAYTPQRLANEAGKSLSFVHSRLKLLQATPQIRSACIAGKIGSEVALLIARLRVPLLQEKALQAINSAHLNRDLVNGGKSSFRSIRNLLNEKFTLELKGAIFDREDATLCPNAGTCSACPKRTANAPEFIDIAEPSLERDGHGMRADYIPKDGPDVCTDPDCFEQKKKAHLAREAEAIKAKGETVIEGNKARQAIDANGNLKSGFVALNNETRAAMKKAGAKVEPVTIQNPRNGKTVKAMRVADLAAAGIAQPEAKPTGRMSTRDWEAERRERDERGQLRTAANLALFKQVHDAAAAAARATADFDLVVEYAIGNAYGDDGLAQVANLWGFKAGPGSAKLFEDAVAKMSGADKALVMLDIAMSLGLTDGGWEDTPEPPRFLHAAAKLYGVDANAAQASAPPSTDVSAARGTKEAKRTKAKKAMPATPKTKKVKDKAGSAGQASTEPDGTAGADQTGELFDAEEAHV